MLGHPAIPVPPWRTFTAAEHAARSLGLVLGKAYVDDDDRIWVYLRANAALVRGNALVSTMAQDSITDIDTVSAIDSTTITDTGSTFVTNGVLAGMMIYIWQHTGAGQIGIIGEVTSETVLSHIEWITSNDGRLTTATDATSDAVIFAPWNAELSIATGVRDTNIIAIAQADVAIGRYFFALRDGIGVALYDNATAAAVNGPLVAAALAGYVTGGAATDVMRPCGTAVIGAAADGIIPIMADCAPISGIPYGHRSVENPTG